MPSQIGLQCEYATYKNGLLHNPNTIKSYKILQKLSPKHAAHGVARSTYPIYGHGKACLSKQPPLVCSWGPLPGTQQVPGSSSGPRGRTARAFFSTLPSFLLREIVFFHTFPTNPAKVLGLKHLPRGSFYLLMLSLIYIMQPFQHQKVQKCQY